MKRILYLGYVWPEPASSAAGGRTLDILRCLQEAGYHIVFASAAALSPHRFDLAAIGIEERSVVLNDDSFDELLQAFQPDIVFFDRFFTEEQFAWRVEQQCPQAIRILDTCDLHSLREARQLLAKTQNAANKNAWQAPSTVQTVEAMRSLDTCLREIAAIFRCDLSLLISNLEWRLLTEFFAVPPYLLQVNRLMGTSALSPSMETVPDFAARSDFVSIGNFRHAPNWDAVLWLKQVIWPAIRSRMPNAVLKVYGAYPPPKATQLHQARDGFLVMGWAPDAQTVMQQARVCLAPLRFGAGIKGKLADAMRAGTPSVTTSIGAEAMHANLDWGGAVCDHVEAFAEAAVELHQNQSAWNEAQLQGYAVYQSLFQPQRDHTLLTNSLEQLLNNREAHRAQNFVGAMLRHHSMKSSHFMSQWIMLKHRVKNALPE